MGVQCQTSVNWSSGSWFWNHFSGGLNYQIEHHLFRSIAHTNYVFDPAGRRGDVQGVRRAVPLRAVPLRGVQGNGAASQGAREGGLRNEY